MDTNYVSFIVNGELRAYAISPVVPRQGEIVWLKARDVNGNDDTQDEEIACRVTHVEWKISRRPPVSGAARTLSAEVFVTTQEKAEIPATAENEPNPELYARMSVPYETLAEADTAIVAFARDVAQLRQTHRIANVVLVSNVKATDIPANDRVQLLTLGDTRIAYGLTVYALDTINNYPDREPD